MNFYVIIFTVTFGVFGVTVLFSGATYLFESLIAAGLSISNAVVAYYLAVRGIKLNHQDFMKSVFGGMMLRLFIFIVVTVFLIKYELVATIPFFLLLVLYYIIHQIVEIGMLKHEISSKYTISGEKEK